MLKTYLKDKLKEKDILLMTHLVLGYPSFEDSLKTIDTMVNAGVDIMELQIPFSEPTADGPVIVAANQRALEKGVKVAECLKVAEEVTKKYDIPFLIMTYYNIPYTYGIKKFTSKLSAINIKGAIIPDLPPEEGEEYLLAMKQNNLAPILIYSPNTTSERMNYLASKGNGFVYCVARKGVTGQETNFSNELTKYLERCRKATNIPLAVGFGIKEKNDVDFLKGKADIAVIGTQTIRIVEKDGVEAAGKFIKSLR